MLLRWGNRCLAQQHRRCPLHDCPAGFAGRRLGTHDKAVEAQPRPDWQVAATPPAAVAARTFPDHVATNDPGHPPGPCASVDCYSSSIGSSSSSGSSGSSSSAPGEDQQGQLGGPLVHRFWRGGARFTDAAQLAWEQVVQTGDCVVDATCGRGNDTLFLARLVGHNGKVFGFDIQEEALRSTRRLLDSSLDAASRPEVHLIAGCHSAMLQTVGRASARVVAFNLGYLPQGDKEVVTCPDTTLAALQAAVEVVCPGGLLTVLAYVGHPGGVAEYDAAVRLLSALPPQQWVATETRLLNRKGAPLLLLLWKQGGVG